jgi:hypothetical protein
MWGKRLSPRYAFAFQDYHIRLSSITGIHYDMIIYEDWRQVKSKN